jgi:hypothetical protein
MHMEPMAVAAGIASRAAAAGVGLGLEATAAAAAQQQGSVTWKRPSQQHQNWMVTESTRINERVIMCTTAGPTLSSAALHQS